MVYYSALKFYKLIINIVYQMIKMFSIPFFYSELLSYAINKITGENNHFIALYQYHRFFIYI